MTIPTAWAPFNSTLGASIPSRAALSLLTIPQAIDGMSVFCTEASFQLVYVFSLNSGATINGTTVLATSIGGNSRWLAMGSGSGSPPRTPILAPPLLTALSWINQGTSIATQGQDFFVMRSTENLGNNRKMLVQAIPAPPYSFVVGMTWNTIREGFSFAEICVTDGLVAPQLIEFGTYWNPGTNNQRLDCTKLATPTAGAGVSYFEQPIPWAGSGNGAQVYLRMDDDGVNLTWGYSSDGLFAPSTYIQTEQRARADFLVPAFVGVLTDAIVAPANPPSPPGPGNGLKTSLTVWHWYLGSILPPMGGP